jgi:glucose/arabinose dehydrogenase
MNRKIAFVAGIALLASMVPSAGALPSGTAVRTYKGGLDFPIDMAWVKGTKKIFFTEKNTGKVRVMVGRRLLGAACVNLDVSPDGERGALGIALHPDYKNNRKLYVYYTNASPLENRVTSFVVRNNRCTSPDHIVTGLQTLGATNHNGGQLEFVRGKLFVSTGEAADPSQSQDTTSRLGKILRYNPNGSIPNDNPFGPTNPVWSYGHRNPFGLTHKPGTGKVYSTENGPSCDDELNYITKGRNYGWGDGYDCGSAGVGTNPKPPIVRWSDIIVPTDPTWYRGRIKSLRGLLTGDYANGALHRFVMNDSDSDVRRDRIVYNGGSSAPIVDVATGPGRWLYFLTTSAIMRVVKT